jgi:hypothetical protein
MLIEEVVNPTSDVKYVVIGRDSDGYQWDVDRGLSKEEALAAGASAAEEDVNVYGENATMERTSEWAWRVRSPNHDYTAWFTVYIQEDEVEEGVAWKKRGQKIVRQFRCTSGARKGRVVASPAQCFKPIDIKKRVQLRRTKTRLGSKATKKSNRTKKFNPVSKRVKAMNKGR